MNNLFKNMKNLFRKTFGEEYTIAESMDDERNRPEITLWHEFN